MYRSCFRPRPLLSAAIFVLVLSLPASAALAQHQHGSPYAGHEDLEISSLTPAELSDLEAGEGMGLARAAELNHYPGPRHSLELAAELGLSASQVERLTRIRAEMLDEAVSVGGEIIETERELTQLFREGSPTAGGVERITDRLGRLYGELRAVHLLAHLSTVVVLTPEQVDKYDRLRGYGGG